MTSSIASLKKTIAGLDDSEKKCLKLIEEFSSLADRTLDAYNEGELGENMMQEWLCMGNDNVALLQKNIRDIQESRDQAKKLLKIAESR